METELFKEIEEFENDNKKLDDYVKEMNEAFMETDWFKDRPEHIKCVFIDYPVFGFYRIKNMETPTRITGFHETNGGEIVAQTHVPIYGMPYLNSTIGGRSINELEKVNYWTERDIEKIEEYASINPTINIVLRHPMGIRYLLDEYEN